MAPFIKDQKGEHKHVLEEAKKAGYGRVRIDGTVMDLSEALQLNLDKKKKHSIDVVVDRITIDRNDRARWLIRLKPLWIWATRSRWF
jgi:excinuclease ABC subunit A